MDTVDKSSEDRIVGLFGPSADEPPPDQAPGDEPGDETPPAEAGADALEPGATPPAEPKEVEVEIDGEIYRVPEKISHRFIQHADYTRKTQDIAELRRVTEAERRQFATERQFEQEVAAERREATLIEAQIDGYKRIDWTKMEAAQIMQANAELQMLKDRKADLEQAITRKRAGFDEKLNGLRTESLTAGNRYIETHVKGFDAAKKRALYAYGIREGYTDREMDNLIDPRLVVTLWKASQYDELLAAKPGVLKRAAAAGPGVKPGAANRNQQGTADAQYQKALTGAKNSTERAQIVQKRMEDKLFGPAR